MLVQRRVKNEAENKKMKRMEVLLEKEGLTAVPKAMSATEHAWGSTAQHSEGALYSSGGVRQPH